MHNQKAAGGGGGGGGIRIIIRPIQVGILPTALIIGVQYVEEGLQSNSDIRGQEVGRFSTISPPPPVSHMMRPHV